jgi:hypothetical protein
MGLGAQFKNYLKSTFPAAVSDEPPAADAVVIDTMVLLHSFTIRDEDEDQPATRLVNMFWNTVKTYKRAVICFDVPKDTPSAKSIEWRHRSVNRSETHLVDVSVEEVRAWLAFNQLYNWNSIIANRQARMAVCEFVADSLVARMRRDEDSSPLRTIIVFGAQTPMIYQKNGSCTTKPEWKLTFHGEADISGIYAAHLFKDKSTKVVCVTVDTDWVLVGALNAFDGLVVQLSHFDRKLGRFVSIYVDVFKFRAAAENTYKVTFHEFASVVLTKGSDYVGQMIAGVGEWHNYVSLLCNRLIAQKNRRKIATIVSASAFDAPVFFEAMQQFVKDVPRTTLRFQPDDGELARLAWNFFYFSKSPLTCTADKLACEKFGGWAYDENEILQKSPLPLRVFQF